MAHLKQLLGSVPDYDMTLIQRELDWKPTT